jgi:hypothetical protein
MKFYHGTSNIFVDSILRKGLGGINPNYEFKHLALLEFFYSIAELQLLKDSEYLKIRTTTKAMVFQLSFSNTNERGETDILHYKHNRIHVSLSKIRAITYACINQYGSEILQRCITIYKLLLNNNVKFTIPNQINKSRIDLLINSETYPVLIEVENIEKQNLQKEGGTYALEVLELVENNIDIWTTHEKEYYCQYFNFELLNPIENAKLKVYRINYTGKVRSDNFKFSLTEIPK